MERRPAVGSKCGVGILHVCQVKDHHQERSDNNIDCSPSHLDHYIKKTVTVGFILDHPVCQVKDHHQEHSDNNIDCSPSHLAHYIKKTVTVRFILDHPVYIRCLYTLNLVSN